MKPKKDLYSITNKHYSLPVNYSYFKAHIYIHGALRGKKIYFLKETPLASFNIVELFHTFHHTLEEIVLMAAVEPTSLNQ